MSEVAWFALLLRALGLLIIVEMFPGTVGYLAYIPEMIDSGGDLSDYTPTIATTLGYLASIGVGIYLLAGGRCITRYCTRDLVSRCAVCDYPLGNVDRSVCPECGVPFSRQQPAQPDTRNEDAKDSAQA